MDEVRFRLAEVMDDERGEVNVSTIGWMVIAAIVVFGLLGPFNEMMIGALQFVRNTLGI